MSLPTDYIPETATPPVGDATHAGRSFAAPDSLDQHQEINTRRAELENPELLRRVRSL